MFKCCCFVDVVGWEKSRYSCTAEPIKEGERSKARAHWRVTCTYAYSTVPIQIPHSGYSSTQAGIKCVSAYLIIPKVHIVVRTCCIILRISCLFYLLDSY